MYTSFFMIPCYNQLFILGTIAVKLDSAPWLLRPCIPKIVSLIKNICNKSLL